MATPSKPEPSVAAEAASAGNDAALPSFEKSARRLTSIVEQLEGGELSLEDSLKLFEEGVNVARSAQARLDEAEKRVEELLAVDANGEPRTRAFASPPGSE